MSGHHLVPARVYINNFLALTCLMILTIVAYKIKIDSAAIALSIALFLAICKASLIVLIFMNVKYSSHLTMIFAASGFVWFLILITFTLADYVFPHRGTPVMDYITGWQPPF